MRRIVVIAGVLALGLSVAGSGLRAQSKEIDIDATMKKIGPAFAALRKGIEGSDAKVAKEQADILAAAFGDTQTFFEAKGKHDAHQWAGDAQNLAQSISKASADSKWDDVKASAGNLGKACQTCHTAYREKAEDGTYRMKPGL